MLTFACSDSRIAAISPEVLENYKDLIADTTSDLDSHLEGLQEKIERLQAGDATAVDDIAMEWHAMLEEKQSTQQGLEMCAELSAQIVQFESKFRERTRDPDRPSVHKHVRSGLGEARGSIQSLVTRLQTHQDSIESQLEAMSLEGALSETVATQLARLQQTKESVRQCIQIVSEAGDVADERSNVFEDITLAENSYAFSVSTVNDLVIARRLNLTGRSRHFGGQVNDETVQKSIEALTQLDAKHIQFEEQRVPAPSQRAPAPGVQDPTSTGQFHHRFGPGVPLSVNKTG